MSHIKQYANKIPKEVRQAIIEGNIIFKAIAIQNDQHMRYLFEQWVTWVEPNNDDLQIDCMYCLENILKQFKAMQAVFVEIEKDDIMLSLS